MASPSKAHVVVRITPKLKERLTLIAKAENRSLNNLIEQFLEYMANYYEQAPIMDIETLLSCYHEAQWSDALGPEYDAQLAEMLADDRKIQQKKLKAARSSD